MSCQSADSEVQHSVRQKFPHSKAQPAVTPISKNFKTGVQFHNNHGTDMQLFATLNTNFQSILKQTYNLKIIMEHRYTIIQDKTHKIFETIQLDLYFPQNFVPGHP